MTQKMLSSLSKLILWINNGIIRKRNIAVTDKRLTNTTTTRRLHSWLNNGSIFLRTKTNVCLRDSTLVLSHVEKTNFTSLA